MPLVPRAPTPDQHHFLRVRGLGFIGLRVWGLGFRVWDLGFGFPTLEAFRRFEAQALNLKHTANSTAHPGEPIKMKPVNRKLSHEDRFPHLPGDGRYLLDEEMTYVALPKSSQRVTLWDYGA